MPDSGDGQRNRWSEIQAALHAGDPTQVEALIEAGADIRYKREQDYDALVDAVHGRDVSRDPRLLDLLQLLIDYGVDLSGVTSYRESGLRTLSRLGRFDAVRLLLDAGADRTHLEWSPLHEAVALGSLADVAKALDAGGELEGRDRWSRTAWLISLLLGDLGKAQLLRDRGADLHACGRCACPPLFYAIQGHHPDVARWLLREGADVHRTDEFGTTALMKAVENDDLECVELFLNAGADVSVDANGTALSRGRSREVILRLLDAGADPADLGYHGHRLLTDLAVGDDDPLIAISPEEFQRSSTRRFGMANPERMQAPFWEAMIYAGVSGYAARQRFGEVGNRAAGPVWCAQRFGQSLTRLPDGRTIQIGGEHEDFYDPDFCIYNDLFVTWPNGRVAIYGYPEEAFPPTDFHTATLVGDSLYLIGGLGYAGTRRYGETPVYRLDLRTLRIERLAIEGKAPGWIYGHQAAVMQSGVIRVWGGKVVTRIENQERHDPNPLSFTLDVNRLRWATRTSSEDAG
jgi:ankyrin repeat protein